MQLDLITNEKLEVIPILVNVLIDSLKMYRLYANEVGQLYTIENLCKNLFRQSLVREV